MSLDNILSETTKRLKKSYGILSSIYPKGSFTDKDMSTMETNSKDFFANKQYQEFLKAALYSAQNGDIQAYTDFISATSMTAQQYFFENNGKIQESEIEVFENISELSLNLGLSFQYLNILQNSSNEIETQRYLNQIIAGTKKTIKKSYGLLEKELLNFDPSKQIKTQEELKSLIETGNYSYFVNQAGNSAILGDIEAYHINISMAYQTLATKENLSEKELETIGAIQELMLNTGISFEYIHQTNSNKQQLKYAKTA